MGRPTPVLEGAEWRRLLDSIPATTLRDLRDRALIATLTYSFARITAALRMRVEDLRPRGAEWTVRGGKQHSMPCHHALAEALRAYIDAAGIVEDRKGWLFRPARGHNGSVLSDITRMPCSWKECVTMFTEEMPWLKGRDLQLVMGRAVCDWLGWNLPD